MTKELILPDLGEGIEGADVSEISVSIGDKVSSDDTVLVLESDKASMEIPAETAGVIKEVFVSIGDLLSEGSKIAAIESATKDSVNNKEDGNRKKGESKARSWYLYYFNILSHKCTYKRENIFTAK